MQTYACFNMFLQKHCLVQVLPRGRASFCTSDLGESEARGASSKEVPCAGCVSTEGRNHQRRLGIPQTDSYSSSRLPPSTSRRPQPL